jgi:hypothetical protein
VKMRRTKEFRAKTAEFDRRLVEFFEDWRSFVARHRSAATLKHPDWLEGFRSYVSESLVCFEKMGRLRAPLRP